jgi:hypothetical protein
MSIHRCHGLVPVCMRVAALSRPARQAIGVRPLLSLSLSLLHCPHVPPDPKVGRAPRLAGSARGRPRRSPPRAGPTRPTTRVAPRSGAARPDECGRPGPARRRSRARQLGARKHYRAAPGKSWAIRRGLEPEYLLTDGPYRFTRNPMHLGGIGIWAGWTAWFGSAPVGAGMVVLVAIYHAGIAWEERVLERRWSDRWCAYASRTPRWVARVSAAPTPLT